MTGYCDGCGNTMCVCDEIEDYEKPRPCHHPRHQNLEAIAEAARAYVDELEGQGNHVDVLRRIRVYERLKMAVRGAGGGETEA